MDKYNEKLINEKKTLLMEIGSIAKFNDELNKWEAVPDNQLFKQDVSDTGDMAERSEDYEERSSLLSVLSSRLEDVEKALSLINTDKFGVCEKCNRKIEEERLEANPSSRMCMNCIS